MAKNTAAKKSEKNLVRGVDLNVVNLTVLNEALKRSNLKVTAKQDVADRVRLYAVYMDKRAKELPADKIADCSVCGGVDEIDNPVCSYCGTGEIAPAKESPAVEGKALVKVTGKAKDKAKDSPNHHMAPVQVEQTGADMKAITKAAVKELDTSVKRIQTAKANVVVSLWELGRALLDNHDRSLFKFRLKDGKPAYTSWATFCVTELQLSREYANNLMAIARTFTDEQVKEYGFSKLKMIVRAPEEAREALLAFAKGATKLEVEAAVQELGGRREPIGKWHGGEASQAQGTATSAANAAVRRPQNTAAEVTEAAPATPPAASRVQPRSPSEEPITAVVQAGRQEIKMLSRTGETIDDDGVVGPRRAFSLEDDPWARVELANGVFVDYRIVDVPGEGIVLIVNHTRA